MSTPVNRFNDLPENLAESYFLKDAGYKFDFSNWPQLFALVIKSHQEDIFIGILLRQLVLRAMKIKELAPSLSDIHSLPMAELSVHVCEVAHKVLACLKTLEQVKTQARHQVEAILSQHLTAEPVAVDSLLVPGRRVTFTHNEEEWGECMDSLDVALASPGDGALIEQRT